MGKNDKITLKLDTPLLKKAESTKETTGTLPEAHCERALAFVFCLRIYDELVRTRPEERLLLKSKLIWQHCLPKHIFDEAALLMQEEVGTHVGRVPVTPHNVKLSTSSPILIWRDTVRKQFGYLYKRTLNTYKSHQRKHPWSVEWVRVQVSDVLRNDLPEKEMFIASLDNVTRALSKDASMLASAIEAILLHYAGHGLDEDVAQFRPETMIPHRDQIRMTDKLQVGVKPLDVKRLRHLITRSMEHRDFLSAKHLEFVHVRLLPLSPGRLKPIERPFWNQFLDTFDVSSYKRQTLVGSSTFRYATHWVKERIDTWWFGGVVFQRSLHSLCQVLLWLHLAPADEKRIFANQPDLIDCRLQAIPENETPFADEAIEIKEEDSARPLPHRSQQRRILWLTEQLKAFAADSTVVGPLSLQGVRNRIEYAAAHYVSGTDICSSQDREEEITVVHMLANLLRPYTPPRNSQYHPLFHVPFVVMANAVLHAAGYDHLVQPLYPTHNFQIMDDDTPLILHGETIHEIFCSRHAPYKIVDAKGTATTRTIASLNGDSILHAFFDRERLASIYNSHDLVPLPGIYVVSKNEVILKGVSSRIKTIREHIEKEE